MRNRNVVTVHGVRGARSRWVPLVDMSDELVAEQVEVYPGISAPAPGTTEQFPVKFLGRLEIVNTNGQMKRCQRHDFIFVSFG